MAEHFKGNGKVEISRFKGLGEMPPAQLRETTMDPQRRQMIQVRLPAATAADEDAAAEAKVTAQLVEQLMGRKAENRYRFIQENRSEEHTSELQSIMRNSYAVFCLTKKIFFGTTFRSQ